MFQVDYQFIKILYRFRERGEFDNPCVTQIKTIIGVEVPLGMLLHRK